MIRGRQAGEEEEKSFIKAAEGWGGLHPDLV